MFSTHLRTVMVQGPPRGQCPLSPGNLFSDIICHVFFVDFKNFLLRFSFSYLFFFVVMFHFCLFKMLKFYENISHAVLSLVLVRKFKTPLIGGAAVHSHVSGAVKTPRWNMFKLLILWIRYPMFSIFFKFIVQVKDDNRGRTKVVR